MSAAETTHPLLDGAGPGWMATETRAAVVALTVGMSDFLHRAATERARPIVISGDFSRMTRPLAEALSSVGGHWVIRTAGDGCYDARTGARLGSPEAALTPPPRPLGTTLHPDFVRASVSNRLHLVMTVSTRHRVSRPIRLGGVLETATRSLAGSDPTAWGATEPLVAAWDRDDLTERTRRRMPVESRWAAVAAAEHPVVGTVHVARTSEGLEETTRAWGDVAGAGDDRSATLADEARELLAQTARVGMPLMGVAFAALGPSDLSRRSIAAPQPEPLALLIGAPGVRTLGLDVPRWTAEHGAATVGSPRLPGVLVGLGSVDGGGWQKLSEVLGSFDPQRMAGLLSIAPQVARRLRPHESEG